MRILYLSDSIIPSRTANSINVMKMCTAFSRMGHEVVLLTIKRPGSHEKARERLTRQALIDLKQSYTWERRAQRVLAGD